MSKRFGSVTLWLPLVILSAVASYPVFVGDGVPRTNDLFTHLYRTFSLDQMISLGYLWPRWSAHLVHGYGYPLYNFFPPFYHWSLELFYMLGFSIPTAFKITTFLQFLATAAGSFFLGRTVSRSWLGGWLTALIYTLSPYVLYDVVVRGSPPESQALAILPWLMLSLWHHFHSEEWSRKWMIVTSLTYAGMVMSHPAIALQISVLLGIWMVTHFRPAEWRPSGLRIVQVGILLALGGGITLFTLLPGFVEIESTRAQLSISQGYTYSDNFTPLAEFFRWPMLPADPNRLNPPVVRPLPIFGLLWAILMVPYAWRALTASRRRMALQAGFMVLTGIWLMTPTAEFAWDLIPVLAFTLYPWRMLGFVGLMLGLLAAAGVENAAEKPAIRWGALALTALTLVATVPWLNPPREPIADRIDQALVSRSEVFPFFIGTTTLGEYLPIDVKELPDSAELREAVIADHNADRLLYDGGFEGEQVDNDPTDARYRLTSAEGATLTYRQFYFPGWQATLNGEPVEIRPSDPNGLIQLDLPPGEHDVHIFFGWTPIRRMGQIATFISMALLAFVVAWRFGSVQTKEPPAELVEADRPQVGIAPILHAAVLLTLFGFFQLVDTPLRRNTLLPDGIWGAPQIEPLSFAGELRMLSFEPAAAEIASDETFDLTLYIQPERNLGVDYLFGVQVLDERGITYHSEVVRPADWRFVAGDETWPTDKYRLEPFDITLQAGTPPGEYRYLVGLVRRDTGQTIATHEFGRIHVTEPASGPFELESGMVAPSLEIPGLRLEGMKQDRVTARPGDPVRMTLVWRVVDPDQIPTSFELTAAQDGVTSVERQIRLDPGLGWSEGDLYRVEEIIRMPAGISAGAHTWAIGGTSLAEISMDVPERVFEAPEPPISIEETFGGVITLVGADVRPCAENPDFPCEVDLVWRAEQEMETSYRIFVHLVNGAGEIIAQADGEPVGWTRPTTGWLPPELLIEEYTFSLPVDSIEISEIRVGIYDPATGLRLLNSSSADYQTLTMNQSVP